MAQATLTLIGLYNYDSTLFENLSLPSGIDSDTATNVILAESGEFEVIYPDIDFLKSYIGVVSKKWYRTFNKWYNALQLEYDPIYNYNRFEEWTDTGTDTGTVDRTGSNTGTISNSGSDTGSINRINSDTGTVTTDNNTTSTENSSSEGQTTTLVNSYDNNTLVTDGQSNSTQSASSNATGTNNTTETRDLAGTDNETRNLASTDSETRNLASTDSETRDLATSGKHSGHMYGNIGVTTSQQMLEAELDIASWNLYQHIADVFVKELCIPVYG